MVAVSGGLVAYCFATIAKKCSLEHYNNWCLHHHYGLAAVYVFITFKAIHQTKITFSVTIKSKYKL